MESTGQSPVSSNLKPNRKIFSSSAISKKPNEIAIKPDDKTAVSSAILRSRSSSAHGDDVMFFRDVRMGPHEEELRFRLIHFWEARNSNTKTLIGMEMLLIDEQETVIQGFIPAGLVEMYMPHLKAGSVYRLTKFYGSRSKVQFSVADHSVSISLSWTSVLSVLEDSLVPFHEDRFRFRSHEEFEANCDLKGDLYDYLGHMKLLTIDETIHMGQSCNRFLPEVQVIWDHSKCYFSHHIEPKMDWRTLTLTMSSSRVFMDTDVQPTRDYLSWLGSNSDIAWKINAEIVTKPEAVTIAELFSYIKQENAKVAWFECTATIDDFVSG